MPTPEPVSQQGSTAPLRDDVFDFSSLPTYGPLPFVEESRPAARSGSRSPRGILLATAAVAAVATIYAGSSAALLRMRADANDRSSGGIVAVLDDPATTGSISVGLRPTLR